MKRHAASLVVVSVVLVACAGYEGGKSPGTQTVLDITEWPGGKDAGESHHWKLYCERSGGTHPNPEQACEHLLKLEGPFAPVPKDAVCTNIYGGPAVAEVKGLFRGETVDARFSRVDGCEIARWEKHAFLFPVAPRKP